MIFKGRNSSAQGCVLIRGVVATWLVLCLVGHAEDISSTNAPKPLPIRLIPSPVSVIRHLIAQPETQREVLLALYPDGLREPLEAKLREYLSMPPESRELKLQATDLRHYLNQLMPLSSAARKNAIDQVPETVREGVKQRLEIWEILPPPMQEEFIANEQVVSYFAGLGLTSEEQRQALLLPAPPDDPAGMEMKIAAWNALPEETRHRVFAQFDQLFSLSPEEKQLTLSSLSDSERDAMEQTLDAFGNLTEEKRAVCIQSFEKFTRMCLAERREFLKKAKAWAAMSATERQQWKELVSRVGDLPPLPPGFAPRVAIPNSIPATNGS